MAVKDHLHIYEKVGNKDSTQFRCNDPDCSHLSQYALIEGKRAICGRCYNNFILTKKSLKWKVPHCDRCTRGKKGIEEVEKTDTIASGIAGILGIGGRE